LSEVVTLAKAAPQPFLLMVELKCDESDDSADPVALADIAYDVVADAGFLDGAIFVGFDWRALAQVRARDGRCWFSTERLHRDARPEIDAIVTADGEGWFPNFIDATPQNVAHARARGLKVGAWTINRQDDMRRLMDLDAICTDRPDLLQALE
jgi:glycerophosphoryl diester phosphodiesterase